MPKLLTPDQLASLLRPGMRVFVQGSSSEPKELIDALQATPEACADIEFVSCQIPGLNRVDFADLHERARFTGLFVTSEMAKSYLAGKVRFLPISYSSMYRYLETAPFDIAFIQVAPGKKRGTFSLGSSIHFVPAVLDRAKIVIAEINEDLPSVGKSISINETRLDYIMPTSHPLPTLDPGMPSDVSRKIGRLVADLVRDGDYVQVGIGKLPSAILEALQSHRGLSCHGGLISDAMIGLHTAGALNPASPLICTSVIGKRDIYDWVSGRDDVHIMPVSYTHDVRNMAMLERFVAINSVLAVDLGGQANAETVNGRQTGGCGGLPDFVQGARLSKGGRSILALPSTASAGKISRIVPSLTNDIASCSRADADYVVTEHGVADLKYKSVDERAQALIAIADPTFQETLLQHWSKQKSVGS